MFEDRIAALSEDTEAMPSISYEKRIYTVDENQDILVIGRNSAYNLVKFGAFHNGHIGDNVRTRIRLYK